MANSEDDIISFKYVYIPADTTESIEQRTFQCPQSDDVMGFINMCKAHFQRATSTSKAEEAQRAQALRASLGDKAAGVDDEMFKMLASQQMVEPIALLANSPETGFVGVFMYCDDQASLKHLPHNMRATQIAAEAGQALQVSGDVFIARYFDNEEDFERLDFNLSELSSSAQWIKDARLQLQRRSERSSGTQQLLQRLQQPATVNGPGSKGSGAGVQQSPSDVQKNKGNEAFKRRDYQTALEHYTAAIKLDHAATAARNNRAQAYLALHMYAEAAADTTAVLQADPSNVKALMRRAAAHDGLGKVQEAVDDCRRVLQLEPHNTDAQERLSRLEQQLAAGSNQQPAAMQAEQGKQLPQQP